MSIVLMASLLANPAHAFCGTYMGSADSQLFSGASQVAMVRQGKHTTLTLANDYEGDLTDFALVIPVPTVLSEADVDVVDSELFQVLDQYSAPRRVAYSCDSGWAYEDGGGGFWGCGNKEYALTADAADTGSSGEDATVQVEDHFSVGNFEIVILSATESGDLIGWLSGNGYQVPLEAEDLLTEYIDGGSYFLAAKVSLDAQADADGVWLRPLQLRYDSDVWSLPVRLGTVNSPGSQDLIVYTLTDPGDGAAGVANYPEVTVEDECVWGTADDDFGGWYEDRFAEAMASEARAAWLVEYSWNTDGCDPCTREPPTSQDLQDLGFEGHGAWLTRLHLRYAPEAVDQDLTLYASGITDNSQIRYVDAGECTGGAGLCSDALPVDAALTDGPVRSVGGKGLRWRGLAPLALLPLFAFGRRGRRP